MRDALMRWPPMRDTSMEGLLEKPVSPIAVQALQFLISKESRSIGGCRKIGGGDFRCGPNEPITCRI
jgi:hypothetical protein